MKKVTIFLMIFWFAVNAYAFDSEQIHIHGFISQGYLISSEHDLFYTPMEDGTFQFNEMGINVISEPVDNLRLGVQLLSKDFGEVGNNEVELDWGYGDYRFRNWLGIRAGLLKRPYGLYNQSRDIDAARTAIFLPLSVYPEVSRNFYLATQGIGIYGILPGNLSYEIQYGVSPLEPDDGIVKQADTTIGCKTEDINNDYIFVYMLRWDTPLSGLAASFTGHIMGDTILETNIGQVDVTKYDTCVASLEYEYDRFVVSAEYRYLHQNIILNDSVVLVDNLLVDAFHLTGAYRFTDWFELGIGYSEVYEDMNDRDGENFEKIGEPRAKAWRKDLAISTRFDISDYWLFKLEGHYMNGLKGVTSDLGDDPSEDWFLFGAKMTFSF